jgi:hypothetical protein
MHANLLSEPEPSFPGDSGRRVGDIEVAQFIYLLLNNQKLRDVIETITSKAVLILGRLPSVAVRLLIKKSEPGYGMLDYMKGRFPG